MKFKVYFVTNSGLIFGLTDTETEYSVRSAQLPASTTRFLPELVVLWAAAKSSGGVMVQSIW